MKHSVLLKFFALTLILAMLSSFTACKKDGQNEEVPEDSTAETGIGGVDVGGFEDILDKDGNVIGQKITYSDGTLKYIEHYNSDGEVKESYLYNKDGTTDVAEYRSFDETGVVTKYITVKYEYANGELLQYNTSYFNQNKWCTASYSYNADDSCQGFFTYEYDAAGNEIKICEYDENMVMKYSLETEYNENDQAVKEITKDKSGAVTSYSLMEYNEKGNISRRTECNSDGAVKSYCDYTYDANGALKSEQVYVSDGQGGFIKYN